MRFLERPESHIAPQFVDTGDMPAETVNTGIFESLFIQGPLSIQGEAAFISVSSSEMSNPSFYAFYVYASYFLSGETRHYAPGEGAFKRVQPKREFEAPVGLALSRLPSVFPVSTWMIKRSPAAASTTSRLPSIGTPHVTTGS